MNSLLELDHLEVFLADTAVGTRPRIGHVLPARTGFDAFVRHADGLVIDESANHADPAAVHGVRGITHLPTSTLIAAIVPWAVRHA